MAEVMSTTPALSPIYQWRRGR